MQPSTPCLALLTVVPPHAPRPRSSSRSWPLVPPRAPGPSFLVALLALIPRRAPRPHSSSRSSPSLLLALLALVPPRAPRPRSSSRSSFLLLLTPLTLVLARVAHPLRTDVCAATGIAACTNEPANAARCTWNSPACSDVDCSISGCGGCGGAAGGAEHDGELASVRFFSLSRPQKSACAQPSNAVSGATHAAARGSGASS